MLIPIFVKFSFKLSDATSINSYYDKFNQKKKNGEGEEIFF